MEIVSPSGTPPVLAAKLADYQAVDVREVWVVRSGAEAVEVLGAADGAGRVFGGLTVPVDAIFEED